MQWIITDQNGKKLCEPLPLWKSVRMVLPGYPTASYVVAVSDEHKGRVVEMLMLNRAIQDS